VTRSLLGELLFRQGKKDEAIALMKTGLERDPKAPLLHRSLGHLLEEAGRIDEAVAQYREYAALAPNTPDSKQMGDRASALERTRRPPARQQDS